MQMLEEHKSHIDGPESSVSWTDDVVYDVYKNDDLNTLPIGILEQMRNHIEQVIVLIDSIK